MKLRKLGVIERIDSTAMKMIRPLLVIINRHGSHKTGYFNHCRHYSKESGVNLEDPDSLDSLENIPDYNEQFYKLHKINERTLNFTVPKLDINNVEVIEQYENLYFDSFKKHEMNLTIE